MTEIVPITRYININPAQTAPRNNNTQYSVMTLTTAKETNSSSH
jgi:hypothetical protein